MTQFTSFVLFVVVVSISSVYSNKEFHESIKPMIMECSKEHGVTEDALHKFREEQSVENIEPCFLSCVFKKAGMMNDKGEFDLETSLDHVKKVIKDDNAVAKMEEIGKICESVNDQAVTDGAAGCERAVLLATCLMKNKQF